MAEGIVYYPKSCELRCNSCHTLITMSCHEVMRFDVLNCTCGSDLKIERVRVGGRHESPRAEQRLIMGGLR